MTTTLHGGWEGGKWGKIKEEKKIKNKKNQGRRGEKGGYGELFFEATRINETDSFFAFQFQYKTP